MQSLTELLTLTVRKGASDLHLKAGSPPLIRLYGELKPLDLPILTSEDTRDLSFSRLTEEQSNRFKSDYELDFALDIPDLARFRGNVYYQRGETQSCFRVIPNKIKSIEELNLPPVCKFFTDRPRGLVLVTGPAGSGKSTTQAAMIDYINSSRPVHIVTIEDPIEFVHTDNKALINQRELDRDTHSFTNALRAVLRQDPDVILVGEMRDLETVSLAVTAAETGHLVFGTLHTTDAVQTIDRIIDVFPQHQQQQIRMQISVNLIGIVSQTLVKAKGGGGRVAAFETLVGIPSVRTIIREAKNYQLYSMIQTGAKQGMMTLDQSLANLVNQGCVDFEDGLEKAQNIAEYKALCSVGQQQPGDLAEPGHHPSDLHPSTDADARKQGTGSLKSIFGIKI